MNRDRQINGFLAPVNRDDYIGAKHESGRVGVVKRVDEAWTAV